jgi:hypothetical protein
MKKLILILMITAVTISQAEELRNLKMIYKKDLEKSTQVTCSKKEGTITLANEHVSNSSMAESMIVIAKQQETRSLEGSIEIGGTITGTLILESDLNYHATSSIIVDGGVLVQEPNTNVYWAPGTGLYVRNGGTYISRGKPGKLCTNIGDNPQATAGYWEGIHIDETASPNTEIIYNLIWDANEGIKTINQKLKNPLMGNVVGYSKFGIRTIGPKQPIISNNYCYQNAEGIYSSHRGLDGSYDVNEILEITSNTCIWNGYDGIRVIMIDGSTETYPFIKNNLCLGNYWNYSFEDGLCSTAFVSHNGSWLDPSRSGSLHIYYFDPEDWGIIIDTNDPIDGIYSDNFFLKQDSVFVNAGSEYVENTSQIGMSTSIDSTPDEGILDLGFHNPNWDYTNASSSNLKSDFNDDLVVDLEDLMKLSEFWLFDYEENYEALLRDIDSSGFVGIEDLVHLAENWLDPYNFTTFSWFAEKWNCDVDQRIYKSIPDPSNDYNVDFQDFAMLSEEWQKTEEGNVNIQINVQPISESTYVKVDIEDYRPETSQVFLIVNGLLKEEFYMFREIGAGIYFDLTEYNNGNCELKVISTDREGKITCSNKKTILFNSTFENVRSIETYESGSKDYFCMTSKSSEDVYISVFDRNENLLWSNTYNSNLISGFVPASITSGTMIEFSRFETVPASSMTTDIEVDGTLTTYADDEEIDLPPRKEAPKNPKFDPKDVPTGVIDLIVRPDNWISSQTNKLVTDKVRQLFHNEFELNGRQATSVNMAWIAQNRTVEKLYYDGHGGYQWMGDLRTGIKLSDGTCMSMRFIDFEDQSLAPDWCVTLIPAHEYRKNFSVAQMGFEDITFALFDCCFAGRLEIHDMGEELREGNDGSQNLNSMNTSDLSAALGNPLVQSWYGECIHTGTTSEYSKFLANEIDELLGNGTLYHALLEGIKHSEADRTTLENPREVFRVRGEGELLEPIL